jgi:hypothetical protein
MLENAGDLGAFCMRVKERGPAVDPASFLDVCFSRVC